jgi:hypothetical protein
MYALMFSSIRAEVKVSGVVVQLVGADVMDDLAIGKRSANNRLHDDSVFKHVPAARSVVSADDVPTGSVRSDADPPRTESQTARTGARLADSPTKAGSHVGKTFSIGPSSPKSFILRVSPSAQRA